MPRHRHQEFLRFLERIERRVPRQLALDLILDNYGTHTHPAVEAWFATHPRYHRRFMPTGASWLNLVERFFAEITDKRIRRGTFRSDWGTGAGHTGLHPPPQPPPQTVRLDSLIVAPNNWICILQSARNFCHRRADAGILPPVREAP
jgi:DDE superfamily endonuclease